MELNKDFWNNWHKLGRELSKNNYEDIDWSEGKEWNDE